MKAPELTRQVRDQLAQTLADDQGEGLGGPLSLAECTLAADLVHRLALQSASERVFEACRVVQRHLHAQRSRLRRELPKGVT